MTIDLPYYHVDAFADRPFTGNQAAVIPLDKWLDDAVLQAIGEENNFAETAFIVPDASGDADYELRWFTPTAEVRMCGHATLASGHIVLGQRPELDIVRFRTRRAGILTVKRTATGYQLDLPIIATDPMDFAEAAAAVGGKPVHIRGNADEYYLLRYGTAAEVLALSPDFKLLATLGNDLFVATAPGVETDVISRVFVPGAGIDEDPVTGSAHAVLAPYWAAELGRNHFTAFQASKRGGHVGCALSGDRVLLTGQCVTVVEGRFHLT
ncbi:MAG: PhzF family phenazine biosynthesis protein [Sphingorhabdus sp.]